MYIKQYADKSNYGGKRNLEDVIGLVIHYTGNKNDTVKNNLDYFTNNKNLGASAHLFVDTANYGKSVALSRVAYSVGKDYRTGAQGEAVFYGKLNNSNTVSIEICNFNSMPLDKKTLKQLIKAIKHCLKYCPNIKYFVRHYDVNGKVCPNPVISNISWSEFIMQIIRGLI